MRVLHVARKDFGDAVRGRRLHLLVALFGLLGIGVGYFFEANHGLGLLAGLAFLGPLAGLMYTQHTIAGKHEKGEMTVLLGLPFSRRDVVVGTYLGRTAVLVAGIASAYAGMAGAVLVTGAVPDPRTTVAGFGLAVVLSVPFVGIALGLSAATRNTTAASIGSMLAYLLFAFQVWILIPRAVLYVLNGFTLPDETPTWARVFEQLSPFAAVRNAAVGVLSETDLPLVAATVPEDPPVYMRPWFGTLVVVVWLVVPATLGYLRFQRRDL